MGLKRISVSVRFSERAAPLRRDCVFFCVDEEWLEEFETRPSGLSLICTII